MATILIVDDDPDIVEAARLFLEKEGHKVVSAANREEGMIELTGAKPDLLILDVMMEQPDDGIAMAQEIRKQGITTPILMLTSIGKITGHSYGRDAETVPVDAFLEKPVKPDVLLRQVETLLLKKEADAC